MIYLVLVLGMVLASVARAADPDLIGWWKLDEGSGDTTIDWSGSGNDGTIHNADSGGMGTGGSAWFNDPERGMVLSFNGDNSSGAYVSTDLIIPAMSLENDFTWAFWGKQIGDGTGVNEMILGNRFDGTQSPLQFIKFTPTKFEFYNLDTSYTDGITYPTPIPDGVWVHHVVVKDGASLTYYRDAEVIASSTPTKPIDENPFFMGGEADGWRWAGYISDARVYNKALTVPEILGAMKGTGEVWPYASSPNPADGALHENTWVNIAWRPGPFALSHDVYLGDNFDDVNAGAESTFQGSQTSTFFVVGFPGFAYPDGLVPGTTYYWRVDEVNGTEPNSPWKGDVWSFSIPPRTAYFPDPADNVESVDTDVQLSWTSGFGAKLHTVYFGNNFDDVDNAAGGLPQGTTTYTPGTLKMAKTYYWRVDEFDVIDTHKGNIWSFTTQGAVGSPSPANGAVDIKQTPILNWTPGVLGASHEVYFGADKDAVKNADTSSPEYKGSGNLGSESYDPGQLEWNTTYYWRVNEANSANADSPWTGPPWSFTTANFLIIDDMESYNDIDLEGYCGRIFCAWIDGWDDPANGSQTGHLDPPFYEENIVHSGNKSMPLYYDNSIGKSESTLTLTDKRDWTVKGVNRLTIWFRGSSSNAAEQMYVALNGTAVVNHDNPEAALSRGWTEWNIDLQAFADQGVNLSNVNSITLGFSSVTGGSGIVYFDDIRLYPPAP